VDSIGKELLQARNAWITAHREELAVRLGEKTGQVIDAVNIHGVTPTS
jgi:hypothetical protein